MCEPITMMAAASTALSVAGSVNQYNQGKKNAKAQRAAAIAEYEGNMRGLNDRGQQELEAAAQQRIQQQREYRSARAQALVAAEDAGIMGNSADALINDLALQQADRDKAVDTNIAWTLQQLRNEQLGASNQMKSRMNAARDPSMTALLIDIGGQAINGFMSAKGKTGPT